MYSPFNIHRFMFGQIALLTILFLGAFTYFLVVKPILEDEGVTPNLMEASESAVIDDIYRLAAFVKNKSEPNPNKNQLMISHLEEGEDTKALIALNPNFKYFIRINDEIFTNKQEQTSEHYRQLLMQTAQLENNSQPGTICTNTSFKKPNAIEQPTTNVFIDYCDDTLIFYEFSGITTPLPAQKNHYEDYLPEWIWETSRLFLFAVAGVFIIASFIIILNFRSIKRVTDFAKKIDVRHLDTPLPDGGLPLEVLPLVSAINEMIDRVNKTKQQHEFFLSTAAHEMRTPLTLLRGRIDILDDSDIKEELIEDIRSIINLVNQLLSLMGTSQHSESTSAIDVVACCKKVISDHVPMALEQGVNISFIADIEKLIIQGDEYLLEIAITNLIGNALSFSKEGDEIKVEVDENNHLFIRDMGPGIAANQISSIFNPFAKFPSNRKGHGLGLAIVDAIVKQYNATISAKNTQLSGAEFCIKFPPYP